MLTQLHEIAKTICSSPQGTAEYHSHIKAYNDALKLDEDTTDKTEVPDLLPILDVPTHWNSTFFMLQPGLKLRKACFIPGVSVFEADFILQVIDTLLD